MTAQHKQPTIHRLIEQTRTCVAQLHDCLMQEFQALQDNNAESLITISKTKEQRVLQLNQLESERQQLLHQSSLRADQFNDWLANLDPNNELSQQWSEITDKLHLCQKQNTTNSIICEKQAENIQEVLQLLAGHDEHLTNTYSADGTKGAKLTHLHDTTA